MAFLSENEIKSLNLKFCGKNVRISDKAVLYNPQNISIDDNSRIDDFTIISAGKGGIIIGKNVHIALFCNLQGAENITLEDFSGLSSRVSLYSSSDDYSGKFMTNPTVSEKFTNVISKPILIKKHSIIGVGACLLPGVTIGLASAVGAFSLVNKSISDHMIAVGVPAIEKVPRKRNLIDLENTFLNE
jgi:acetyltransferase-like isoleucine patch superfamily enzyme